MSRTATGVPGVAGFVVGVVVTVVVCAVALPPPVGRWGAGGFPHPINTAATISERTPR